MATAAPALARRQDHVFYTSMAALVTGIVFIGFGPTFYLRPHFTSRPLPTLLVVHGLLFSSWIVLLLLQSSLVTAGRIALHRRIGVLGGIVAALMPLMGTTVAIVTARHALGSSDQEASLRFLTISFGDIWFFALFVGLALWWRRRPELHKRLILVGTFSLLAAAFARFPLSFVHSPWAYYGLTDLLLAICVAYDGVTRHRLHPAYLWGGLVLIASQPLRIALGATALWLHFAGRLVGATGL